MGDTVWLHISMDRLKGKGNKLEPIRYVPFTILANIGTNDYRLDLPIYMQMYYVASVENLKLYETPIIMEPEDSGQVPLADDFAPKYLNNLVEDIILDK